MSRGGIFSAFLLVVGLAFLSSGAEAGTMPIRAKEFLDSLGVCTHIIQGIDDPRRVARALKYSGFRHVREDATHSRALLNALIGIHKETGVTFDELPIVDSASERNIPESLAQYEYLADAGALLSVEGPNEPNNFPISYGGIKCGLATTFAPVALYQRDLYAATKADPKLAHYPVFASSEAGGAEPDNQGLQFLTIPSGAGAIMPAGTRYADYANLHNYVHGNGMRTLLDNTAWGAEADGASEGTWDGLFGEYGVTWHKHFQGYSLPELPDLPKVTTETGWHTAGPGSISEQEQGRLLIDLYLAAAARHWRYTFVYMLVDEPQAGNGSYGVFRRDYTPKPAATYLHNLTRIVADGGSSSPPTPVGYTISDRSSTLHDLLLEKSTGVYDLAIWSEQVSGLSRVTVDFGTTVRWLSIYDVVQATSPIRKTESIRRIDLTIDEHPLILEFHKR